MIETEQELLKKADPENFIVQPIVDIFNTPETQQEIIDYLTKEITEVESDSGRSARMKRNTIIQRQRLAQPESDTKDFPWENACFSKEVDILTETGWKKVKDVKVGEKVLTREPFSGKSYFTPVSKTYEFDAPEEGLIKLKNLFMNIDVTANHRFLLENKSKTLTKEVMAIDILKGFEGQTNYYVPLTSEFENTKVISFFGYDPIDFMSLLGWYISEGWSYKNNCIGIAQSEKANPDNVEEIKELLNRLGLYWTYNGASFLIDVSKDIASNFKILGRSWEKFIPRMYLEASRDQLDALFTSMLKGDGHVHKHNDKHRNYPSITYTTVSKQLADDFQELVTRLGYSGNIREYKPVEGGTINGRVISGKRTQYTISVRFTKKTRFRRDRCSFEFIDYTDKVYCVDVPPEHTIYVRQNGLPIWTMNSNVTPTMALQKTNQVVTKILNKFLRKKPLIQYEASEPYTPNAKALTKYVQLLLESPYAMDFYRILWTLVYETVSLGTEFVKVPFVINRMNFTRKDSSGAVEKVSRITKASPEIIHIPMEDFLTRPEWTNLQKAPWIATRYYKFRHELEALQSQGFYTNVDLVLTSAEGLDEHKKDQMKLLGVDPTGSDDKHNDIFRIYECNVFWDVDGDGFAEDIIIHFEKDSGTILRAEFNDLGIRDYTRLKHIEIPDNLYALGVGDILLSSQDEIETLHNMRNDALQLSVLPIVISSESSNFGDSQELYPGKILKTPIPREDIIIHKFPDVGASIFNAETLIQANADRATGASEALSGNDVGGSNRIGATGTQFLAGQSIGYIDAISNQMEHDIAELGMLILYQLVKNSEYVSVDGLTDQEQTLVEEVLSLNVEDIPAKFKFRTRLSTIVDSPQEKQNQAVQLFQLYMAYGDKISQLAAQMASPQMTKVPRVTESLQTYFVGLTKIMEKVLDNFDEDAVGDYLPFIQDLEFILNQEDKERSAEVKTSEAQQENNVPTASTVPTEQGSGGNVSEVQGGSGTSVQGSPELSQGNGIVGGAPA